MKRNLFTIVIFMLSVFTLTSFSIRENPQDPQHGEKVKKHIVLEKIDDKGHKTSLDTVIGNDDFFVWHGDTIGGKADFKWSSKDGLKLDSLVKNIHVNFDYDIKDDGNGKIFVIKSGKGEKQLLHDFIVDDSTKVFTVHVKSNDLLGDNDIMIWNDKDGNNAFFAPGLPNPPHVPDAPGAFFSVKKDRTNIIDLSDPGIVSYKKKKGKDGTEKITIVRKQANENDYKNMEEIITAPRHVKDVIIKGSPEHVTRVKVIKDGDKEKEMEIEENSDNN